RGQRAVDHEVCPAWRFESAIQDDVPVVLSGEGQAGRKVQCVRGRFVEGAASHGEVAVQVQRPAIEVDSTVDAGDVEASGSGVERAAGQRQRPVAAGGADIDNRSAGRANAPGIYVQRAITG